MLRAISDLACVACGPAGNLQMSFVPVGRANSINDLQQQVALAGFEGRALNSWGEVLAERSMDRNYGWQGVISWSVETLMIRSASNPCS